MMEMANMDIEDIKARIPPFCPFCIASGLNWTEFEAFFGQPVICDTGTPEMAIHESKGLPKIQVFCTHCSEEIREEDVEEAKEAEYQDYLESCAAEAEYQEYLENLDEPFPWKRVEERCCPECGKPYKEV